jgi:hypothetical protein
MSLTDSSKYVAEAGLIRLSHSEFGPPIPFVRKTDGSLRFPLITVISILGRGVHMLRQWELHQSCCKTKKEDFN